MLKIPHCGNTQTVSGNLADRPYIQNQSLFFVTVDNPNRYRISTKFTMVKVFVFVGLFSIIFNVIRDIRNNTITSNSITGLTLGALGLAGIFYFIRTRKQIDYDGIKQVLYVVDKQKMTEFEIQVENIDKILYSAVGFNQSYHSYVIVYRDFQNQQQKVRLFPIPFDNSIDTIITDTKLKNPNLVTRSWSIGWNEFLD